MSKSYYPYLALVCTEGFSRADCFKLPGDWKEAFSLLKSNRRRMECSRILGKKFGGINWPAFESQVDAISKNDVCVICFNDDNYPSYLKDIAQPPPIIFAKGNISSLRSRGVAIVGTRRPTAKGAFFARSLAAHAARKGIMTASGMARGIDAAAHEGSLEAPGMSVGVLGTGVDICYPPENKPLMEKLISRGCVISELLMKTEPRRFAFPRRNRLISALSRSVVVVEAGPRSGALITVQWALEQGRDVGAVPGNPGDFRSRGTNELLKKGAYVVEGLEDILEAVPLLRGREKERGENRCKNRLMPGEKSKTVSAIEESGVEQTKLRRVLSSVTASPCDPDALARETGLDIAELGEMLTSLELKGLIAADLLGRYYKP